MPRLKKLRLNNFSIYSSTPVIDVQFNDGAFCLAGANGLGKSTFLNTLNFALTGIVPDPERTFLSVDEYYNFSKDFADSYFDGRIDEAEREVAEVSIDFEVGAKVFHVSRGIFEKGELRELSITDQNGSVVGKDRSITSAQRHQLYVETLPRDIGLSSFEQFVFLQHFVFTFDERRHLLFWDQKLLEQVLHLCFGVDPSRAQRADEIRREIERADSLARNYQWQATELRRKLEELEEIVKGDKKSGDKGKKLIEKFTELQAKRDAEQSVLIKTRAQRDDAELALAQATASFMTKKQEYEAEFSHSFSKQGNVEVNPTIVASVESGQCEICGTASDSVSTSIRDPKPKN